MANSKATITNKNERKLHSKSRNRCAMCKCVLVDVDNPNAACVGENAHIYGEKPGSARYDASKDKSFVNSEQNLIFLCCNCHKKIDTDVNSYPPEKLFELKSKHENWVYRQLEINSTSFGFAELEVLVKYIIKSGNSLEHKSDYSILDFNKKIEKNSLQEVQQELSIGLLNVYTIEDYLNRHPDTNLSSELTNIMSDKYCELRSMGLNNVEIFDELKNFACGYSSEFSYIAAGLGILTYFFEKCEVFEK